MKNNYSKLFLFFVLMLSFQMVIGQTQKQQEEITSRYDKEKLNQLQTELEQKAIANKQQIIQLAASRGLQVTIEEEGTFSQLQRFAQDGSPIYYSTYNVAAARSTRTNHLNGGGSLGLNLDGQNMIGYVWDGGHARVTHQEYDGPGGNNRVTVEDAASEGGTQLNFHAAHVTGTVTASGVDANAKGMAPQANVRGYMWNNDIAEATSAAANGMLLSNHSYGFRSDLVPDQYFGAYIDESRDWDEVMFNAPNYLMVVAAGNDGNTNYNGSPLGGNSAYDKLTGHSTSKNNMVVANAQDANIDANGNVVSVSINSSSSEGPTDDLRIKPDITGNGTAVYSTYQNSDTAYNSITGTSMASPNVMGSLLLLQQHASNVNGSFMKAATLKGLALHTADDAGSNGPDAIFGWGLMNSKRAAEAITQNGNESLIDERTLTSGQSYTITVDSDGTSPLLASISWTDRAGTATTATNSATAKLVNDLDVRVTKSGTTFNPWRLTGITTNGTGDNSKDPYERVDVNGASGTYTITVTHKGSLVGGSQNFSLVVTGLSGTPVVCNATIPTGLSIDGFGSSTATVSWNAVTAATYDVRHRATGTSSWTTNAVSGVSTSISGLSPETQYEVQVRSKCADGSNSGYSASSTFTTTEVQLNYCASNGNSVADEYISNVSIGSINNTTGASSGGYADYTSQSTGLTQGNNYSISITPTWTGTLYNEGYSVWIDYNHDGDFTDTGEQVWSQAASQTTPVSGNFTIPNATYVGTTRMRVTMQYNTVPSSCGSFNYGEVEDYTVNLGAGIADTTAPVITLNGSSTINLNVEDSFTDPGASATDNIDGNLTSSIVVTGSVNTSAVGTYTLNYNVSDAAGNAATQVSRTVNVTDGTAPVIALNGSSTINLEVGDTYNELGATATDNVDGNLTSSIVITGTVNTNAAGTYTRNYNVSDAAGNAANQVSRTIIVTQPSTGGCTGGISSFPYTEGFENTLGAWTQSTADDINWTVDANGTPSGNTGPSSATQGSYYVYVEASGNNTGYPNKQAILNSPCFDLSGETEATFSFKYHMYGAADMGTIALEASDDNGSTWTSIWNESGNKGNAWLSADVSLNAYAGGTVQLRFNRITGSTWQADIAIDDVSLTNGSSGGGNTLVTLSITFDNYPEETSWEIRDSDNSVVTSGGTYASQADGSTLNIDTELPVGCYSLVMMDAYGDGICCTYGNGSYMLSDGTTTLASGGTFTSSDTTSFCVGGATNATNYVTTTSNNSELDNQFKVHPNPVQDILNVSLIGFEAQSFEVRNMIGQLVLKGRYTNSVNVSELDAGVYILQLNIGKKTKVKRFIKE